jgi:lysine-specific demethylase 8
VSPLHNDPYHNLLGQVVGTKYVRMYGSKGSDRVYPRSGPLCNNSLVNLDAVDNDTFPAFRDAPCWQAVLGPGDLLFVPRHHWHYVRSLELSFSVSFWWGAKMGLRRHPASGDYEAVY